MSNYTKLTSYDTKDNLTTGDPLKRVKGTELDDEFDAIATAIATKADTTSPSFSGTPTVPTASFGNSTTQAASTAFVQAALAAMYPVGSVYTNASVSTNPATLFGFGTWVAIAGRVVVGYDSADAEFDTVGDTGGSKNAVVVAHSHGSGVTGSGGRHYHGTGDYANNDGTWFYGSYSQTGPTGSGTSWNGSGDGSAGNTGAPTSGDLVTSMAINGSTGDGHTHTITEEGVSGTNANLQPYVVAYVWKRTA